MAESTRNIAVVTGTRAEFGLLLPVMRAVAAHARLKLQVIVAGAHLTSGTWRDVTAAKLPIAARVRMQTADGVGRVADVSALGKGISGFGRVFAKQQPDFVVVLGDRIEAFAAAAAASIGGYRVAHIHGGDRAEGVADEAMRHAISKLAHLHLPATVKSRSRLIRMGESAATVHVVGSPAVDGLAGVKPDANGPRVIVMQHPIGESDAQEKLWMTQTLAAVQPHDPVVMMPNSDPGSRGIRAAISAAKVKTIAHLPREQWLAMLAGAMVLVGNSSAGLIEAAVLGTAAVNIGSRQAGRERASNVIDCDYGTTSVAMAVAIAMKRPVRRGHHPYGRGETGERIANLLATIPMERLPLRKRNAY